MDSKSNFEKVKEHVRELVEKDIEMYKSINYYRINRIENDTEYIRLNKIKSSLLDEATVHFLMRLTNSYVWACLTGYELGCFYNKELFVSLGLDQEAVKELDNYILCIANNKDRHVVYSMNGEYKPNEQNEEILRFIFSYFGCPGELPRVKRIYEIFEELGIEINESDYWLPNLRIDKYSSQFAVAKKKGISFEEFSKKTVEFNKILSFYFPPRSISSFNKGVTSGSVTAKVGLIDDDYDQMLAYQSEGAKIDDGGR